MPQEYHTAGQMQFTPLFPPKKKPKNKKEEKIEKKSRSLFQIKKEEIQRPVTFKLSQEMCNCTNGHFISI